MRGRPGLAIVLMVVLGAGAARAQKVNGIDFERFKPTLDLQGVILTEGGQGELAGNFNIGIYLHFSHNPLEITGTDLIEVGKPERYDVISDRLVGHLYGSIGITDWLAFGVDVPAVLDQDGTRVLDRNNGAPLWKLDSFAMGDVRVSPKVTMLRQRLHGVSMALAVPVSLPSGDQNDFSGAKDDSVTASPTLAISRTFADEDFLVALNVGAWLRSKEKYPTYEESPDLRQYTLGTGHEFFTRLGCSYRFAENWWALLEVSAAAKIDNLFAEKEQTPLEGLVGVRLWGPGDVVFTFGGGMGFVKGWGTPDFRVFFGALLAPRVHDQDGDGIADKRDRCPDRAGPRENNGCPWPDTDGDGVADNLDRCPGEAGPGDNNGCPWGDRDGDGLKDNQDKCPRKPGPRDNRGCPYGDADGDGITDDKDECPQQPGPEENGGCPWGDQDGDGVKDNQDECPDKAGPADSPQGRGCPKKYTRVKIIREKKKIEIGQKIHFAYAGYRVRGDSLELLDQVARAINDNPDIRKVRIEGHTDSRGPEEYNQHLSERRAESVMKHLLGKGVDPKRLEAVGYGEGRPIASNDTDAGREANRRVEFVIVE